MIKNIYFDYQATTPVDPRVKGQNVFTLAKFMEIPTKKSFLWMGSRGSSRNC